MKFDFYSAINDFFSFDKTIDDVLFVVRYMPKAIKVASVYGVLGAVLGFSSSYVYPTLLKQFAAKNHQAVDVLNQYVPDDEEFLHLSRNMASNHHDEPVSSFFPVYSSLLGTAAGLLFAGKRLSMDFSEKFQEDRANRALNRV